MMAEEKAMDFMALSKLRHIVRKYAKKPVEQEKVKKNPGGRARGANRSQCTAPENIGSRYARGFEQGKGILYVWLETEIC